MSARPAAAQVVVMVNGLPITSLDIQQRERLERISGGKAVSRDQALKALIDDKLKITIAKRYGLDTQVGAWLDPAADKLLMLASFLALTYIGVAPPWLTVLVLARDAAIVLGVLLAKYMAWHLRVQPQLLGKISTAIQVAYVGLMLLMLAFEINLPNLAYVAAVTTAVFTLAS